MAAEGGEIIRTVRGRDVRSSLEETPNSVKPQMKKTLRSVDMVPPPHGHFSGRSVSSQAHSIAQVAHRSPCAG